MIYQSEDKIAYIFKFLARECIGELVSADLKPLVKNYLEILMEFLLMHYEVCYLRIKTESLIFNKIILKI